MSDTSSLIIIGDEQWPPGFRFHPTDEELLLYYLKRKICRLRLRLDAIAEVDVYKSDPEELPRLSKLKTGDRQWFFFSPRDRKYPSGGRSNRATKLGYWKATGKDRPITCNSRSVGIKKTLVFYRGRAPSGKRTDWVMHEYTLDEEELKRCPAQDYYALYKIYKKSGPGPKNGEQYGAPFREEDWADDVATDSVDKEEATPAQQFSQHAASVDYTLTNCQNDELVNRMINEDTQSTLLNQSLVDKNVQEKAIVFPSYGHLNGVQPCLNSTQSASSQFLETSEVTYASNMIRQGSHDSEKDFIENFLEIDDLIEPVSEPIQQNTGNSVDDLRIEDFDGLCELDLFQDVSTFLQDTGDTEPASHTYNYNCMNQICDPISISCPNNFDNGLVGQVSNSYLNNFLNEPISQPYNNIGNEMVNQFNYEMPHDPDVADQLWMNKPNFNMPTPAVTNQGSIISQTSGVVYSGVNQNQFQNHNQIQNQNGKVIEGEESWLSSTLWSFVETIPTTPASATESTVLVNQAFERLSSFGKRGDSVKLHWLNKNSNACDPTSTPRRSRYRYSRGFMLFSLGVLSAILLVFTGTSMRVLGRGLS